MKCHSRLPTWRAIQNAQCARCQQPLRAAPPALSAEYLLEDLDQKRTSFCPQEHPTIIYE